MASPSVDVAALPQTFLADPARRILAHLIDITIAFTATMAAGVIVLRLGTLGLWTVSEGERDPVSLWHALSGAAQLAVIVAFVVSKGPFYSGLLQSSAWQASIGKRLLSVYVTDTAGRRLGLLRSLGRSFAKDLFNSFLFLGIVSVATMGATSTKQALHDYAARTVVVKGRPPGNHSPGVWRFVVGFGIQCLWYAVTMVAVFRTLS